MHGLSGKAFLLTLLVLLLCAVPLFAQAETSGTCGENLTWVLDDEGTLTITGTGWMYGYRYNESGPWGNQVKKAILSPGVISIGSYAFHDNASLSSITIPDSVIGIGSGAFSGCSSLASISIPNGVTSIDVVTFRDCSSLTSIKIPDGVTSIGFAAFENCKSLTSINIPAGVTSIDEKTFRGCSSLPRLSLPAGVTSIGEYAFDECSSLTSINIPAGVTSIGESAFSDCKNLTAISLPAGIKSIAGSTFSGCSRLSRIAIPAGVTSIGQYAFNGCSSLNSINLPTGITSIGSGAFWGCKSLTSVTLPVGITKIADYTFYSCSSLTNITIPVGVSKIEHDAFNSCSRLGSITIPEGVTSIGYDAFLFCDALHSVYLPDSMVSIHGSAFEYVGFNFTIYCNEFSYAETWAATNDYHYVLLDAGQAEIFLPDTFTLPVGSTRPLDCTIMPSDPTMSITWSSSDPAVAAVDEAGVVTALSGGTTTITVKVKNASASCKLTVVQPATELSLPETIHIVAKSKQPVPLSVTPGHAVTQLTYKTEDKNYLQVSEDGMMTAGAVGTTKLTVQDRLTGLITTATVRITYPVSDVTLEPDSVKLISGRTAQLTATVTMRTEHCVNQLVTFKSSDQSVAKVNQQGVVTAVGAGTATITATADSGASATCTVTVISKESCPPGDANLDGVTSMADAVAILHYAADGTGEDFGTMDMDGNGTVDIYDAFMILQQEAGW